MQLPVAHEDCTNRVSGPEFLAGFVHEQKANLVGFSPRLETCAVNFPQPHLPGSNDTLLILGSRR